MTLRLAILFLCCVSASLRLNAQPMPPAVQHVVIGPRPPRSFLISWTPSSNAAGYTLWIAPESDRCRPQEIAIGQTNKFRYATTNRARLFYALAALNSNGVACGAVLEAHWPRYPDVFDHLRLTVSGGQPPFTIETVGTLSTASETNWQFLTVLEDTRELEITDAVERVPTFYRASAEEEVELQLTTVWKPDPREL